MNPNHVEIAVTCRVNGVLVVNTFTYDNGNDVEEAVKVAVQAASIVKNYQHHLQDQGNQEKALNLSKCLTQIGE